MFYVRRKFTFLLDMARDGNLSIFKKSFKNFSILKKNMWISQKLKPMTYLTIFDNYKAIKKKIV